MGQAYDDQNNVIGKFKELDFDKPREMADNLKALMEQPNVDHVKITTPREGMETVIQGILCRAVKNENGEIEWKPVKDIFTEEIEKLKEAPDADH